MSKRNRLPEARLVLGLWLGLSAGLAQAATDAVSKDGSQWPQGLSATVAVRVGRPTGRLEAIKRFYVEGLGLPVIGGFQDHAGFSGIILGLPGVHYHLEFTETAGAKPDEGKAPTDDNNLVLYFKNPDAVAALTKKLAAMGFPAVRPPNPYWVTHGAVTIPDPDGWRVILMPEAPDL